MSLPEPVFLEPAWRFAGDAWMAANALTYVVYSTPPVYAADGVTVTTPGVLQPLAGYTVTGTLRYQPRSRGLASPPTSPAALPAMTGAVTDPVNSIISLSLSEDQTVFPKQLFAAWDNPGNALLLVQPRVVDSNGNPVTVGLQQLFVF